MKEGQNRTFLPVSNDVIDAVNRDYDRFFNQSEEKITEWRRKIYDLTKFNKNLADQVNIEDLLLNQTEEVAKPVQVPERPTTPPSLPMHVFVRSRPRRNSA